MRNIVRRRAAALLSATLLACTAPALTATPAAAADQAVLRSGQRLEAGASLSAGESRLVMQLDGNLVLYRKRDGKALWSTRTYGHPGAVAMVRGGSGEFSVFEFAGAGTLWSNRATDPTGAEPKLQDDGNFVLYNGHGRAIWSTGTWGNW
ncbi:hypothetical protein [Kitasatospora sp. NPDC004289]